MRALFCLLIIFLAFAHLPAQETEQVLDSLKQRLEELSEDSPERADLLNELGYHYWIVNSGISVDYGKQALLLAENLNYDAGIAKAKRVLGVAYWTLGEAKLALENLYHSQEVYKELGEEEGFANSLMNTGMVYADIGEYERSLQIYDESIRKFTELGLKQRIATTFTKIGDVQLMMGNLQESKDHLNNALQMHSDLNYIYGMGEAHNKLAVVLLELGELEQADYHLKRAVELGRQVNDEDGFIGNLIQYGKLQRLRGNYADAEEHLTEALQKASQKKLRKYVLEAYKQLKLLKKAQGDYEASLGYYDAFIALKDSIYNADKSKQIAAMEFGQELEDQQKEIALLQEKKRNAAIVNWSLGLGLLGICVIGYLLFNHQRQKTLKQQELLASKEELAKTALENAHLKQNELKQQLDFKNKELTSYTLNFVQKNELLQQLHEQIADAKNSAPGTREKLLTELDRSIKKHITIDKDWEDFRRFFEEVHTDFHIRLKERHPDLSANDLKICSLTRLNLNVKETARILGISPESAKTARYRLRKKIGLPPEKELLDYFLDLENENLLQ